mgnify:CR=1 FL=1
MIDPIFQSGNYQLATKLLDASALRQQAIASNIANAETPGYRRLDVSTDFATQLKATGTDPQRLGQVLKNLLVKAVTAPGRLIGRALGGGEDADLEEVRFDLLQAGLGKVQRKALDQLAKGLEAKPELIVALVPLVDPQEEQEELAAFLIKQEFLQITGVISAEDSARILLLSTRDSLFVGFLNGKSPGTVGQGERQRCLGIVGAETVKARCSELEAARQGAVKAYVQTLGLVPSRITLRAGTAEETKGLLGRPGYRFVFDAGAEPSAVQPARE